MTEPGFSRGGAFIATDMDNTLDCSYNDLKNALDGGQIVILHMIRTRSGELPGNLYESTGRFILNELREAISESEEYSGDVTAHFHGNEYFASTPNENMMLAD